MNKDTISPTREERRAMQLLFAHLSQAAQQTGVMDFSEEGLFRFGKKIWKQTLGNPDLRSANPSNMPYVMLSLLPEFIASWATEVLTPKLRNRDITEQVVRLYVQGLRSETLHCKAFSVFWIDSGSHLLRVTHSYAATQMLSKHLIDFEPPCAPGTVLLRVPDGLVTWGSGEDRKEVKFVSALRWWSENKGCHLWAVSLIGAPPEDSVLVSKFGVEWESIWGPKCPLESKEERALALCVRLLGATLVEWGKTGGAQRLSPTNKARRTKVGGKQAQFDRPAIQQFIANGSSGTP